MYHAFDAGNLYPEVMKYYEDDDPDLNKNKKNLKEEWKKIRRKTRREQTTQDNFSPIDPLAPNYHKYPQSKHASLIKCILNPGDALYMPSFTWHNVVSEGEDNKNDIHIGGINMGVNVWFGGDKRFQIPSVIEAIIWNRMS